MTHSREPPIRTFTVGRGVPPHPPSAGGRGVADYYRRFDLHRPRYTREFSTRRAHSTLDLSLSGRQSGRGRGQVGAHSTTPRGRRRHGRSALAPQCRRCRSRPRLLPTRPQQPAQPAHQDHERAARTCTSTSSAFRPASSRTASRQAETTLGGHEQLIRSSPNRHGSDARARRAGSPSGQPPMPAT